jgi:hypothetical protein
MTVKDRLLVLEVKIKDILFFQKIQMTLLGIILTAMLVAWKWK